ncbi:MAG: hypothetical protein V4653_10580 [Pseudomonadota bacterium]
MEMVIRIVGLATEAGTESCGHSNRFLRDFDPDAYGGRGRVRSTDDPVHAKRFPDTAAAHACWTLQSRRVPLRDDGRPNRPLTAYTCEMVPIAFAVPPETSP